MQDSTRKLLLIVLWLAAASIATILALNLQTAAFVDGHYVPVGNDSFYHARRIIDAAMGLRGFYQFDTMIHVPEGSWVTWPWAYDYLMAVALMLAMKLSPAIEPMAFLAYVPVAWVFVNTGLLLLICRKIGLGLEFCALAMLAFCISPLTQSLHGVGIIDHHFVELSFMLATVWLGLCYFDQRESSHYAVAFGIVLGIAPAFHNGLFILQLPALCISFVMWLQLQTINPLRVRTFSISLLFATLLVLLPSAPFRDLQFEFSTLSWFHLYIAACTAICSVFMTWSTTIAVKKKYSLFVFLISVLALPLLAKISEGAAFVSGSSLLLDRIVEVQSPLRMYLDANNSLAVTRLYSWLIVLGPILILFYVAMMVRARDVQRISLSVFVTFGLLMLLAQFRLHPFGYWALIVGPLVLLENAIKKFELHRAAIAVGCLAIIALSFQPPLKHQLFVIFPAGLTKDYAASRSMFPVLKNACENHPGTALSYRDDGHPIRYHSDCSVVANNFLLTEQHAEKAIELDKMLNQTPEQLIISRPDVDYVFVRLYGLFANGPNGPVPTTVEELRATNAPLFSELMFRPKLPDNYQLLGELRVEDERDIPFVRVYRIERQN